MIKIIRAKLHGLRITGADLNYHGSITLDPETCGKAGIYPLEFVYVWNKNNGQRISTYVIYGKPGSRCCVLNGAAARCCQPGDEVIITAVEYVDKAADIAGVKPHVLTFDERNNVKEHLRYDVGMAADGAFSFAVVPEQ